MPFVNAAEFSSTRFDYVVVGGGVGGLTLATRLTEDPNISVGVINAGGHITDMPEINIPGYIGKVLGNPAVDWAYFTEPQPRLAGRKIFQPRGKTLGGTSVLNFMVLSRANSDEYDALEVLGNEGWNWEGLLPYLKKFETLTPPSTEEAHKYDIKINPGDHGMTGPVAKSYPNWYPEIHSDCIKAMNELGIPSNPDPANGDNVGVYTCTFSIDPKTATRVTAATSYYEPNKTRSNLHILPNALATKIITEKQGDLITATGVQFECDEKTFVVNVKREVILSAGAFNTPQLLELSGIGNPKILEKFGITTLIDLPGVGENLQDHMIVPNIQEVTKETLTVESLAEPGVIDEHGALYATKQSGMFSAVPPSYSLLPLEKFVDKEKHEKLVKEVSSRAKQNSGYDKQLALHSKWFKDPTQALIEVISLPVWLLGDPGERKPAPGAHYITHVAALLHPLSRGSVHITSADPKVYPAVDPNYLADPLDLEILVEAFKFLRKYSVTGPVGERHVEYAQPGPEVKTDKQIKDWIRDASATIWHPLGTASMVPRADGGVVDSNLKVYGTNNLRVVDASILPMEETAHPQSAVYAIAEKAADMIKNV